MEELETVVQGMIDEGYGEDSIKEVVEAWEAGVRPDPVKTSTTTPDAAVETEVASDLKSSDTESAYPKDEEEEEGFLDVLSSLAARTGRGFTEAAVGLSKATDSLIFAAANIYDSDRSIEEKKALRDMIEAGFYQPGIFSTDKLENVSDWFSSHVRETESESVTEALQSGNFSEAAELTIGGALESMPSILAAFTGYGGIALFGASVAGNKFDEEFDKNPEEALGTLYANAAGNGIIEAGFELATRGLLKQAGFIAGKSGKRVAKQFLADGATSMVKRMGWSVAGEGASEAATEVTSMLWDNFDAIGVGVEDAALDFSIAKDADGYKLGESIVRTLDAGIIGAFMGGSITTVGQLGGATSTARNRAETLLTDFETRRKQNSNAVKISELAKALETETDPIVKKEINKTIKALEQNMFVRKRANSRVINNMTQEELVEQFDVINQMEETRSALNRIKDKRTRSAKILKRKYEDLKNQKQQLHDLVIQRVQDADIKNVESLAEEFAQGSESLTQEQIDEKFKNLPSEDRAANGFVDPDTGKLIINKTRIEQTKNINTGAHEFLHTILKRAGISNPKILEDFKQILKDKNQLEAVEKRINAVDETGKRLYSTTYLKQNPDEFFTQFSEALKDGDIRFDEGLFGKIEQFLSPLLKAVGFKESAGFNSGAAIYEFMKGYQTSMSEGKLNKDIEDLVKSLPIEEIPVEETTTPTSKEAEALEEIFETQGVDGAFEILEGPVVGNIVKKILNKYENVPNFDRKILSDEIKTGKDGIFELIQKYPNYVKRQNAAGKPVAPLTGYINSSFGTGPKSFKKYINIAKRNLGEQFVEDIDQATGVIAKETAEDVVVSKDTQPKKRTSTLRRKLDIKQGDDLYNLVKKVSKQIFGESLPDTKLRAFVNKKAKSSKNLFKDISNLMGAEKAIDDQFLNKNILDILKTLTPSEKIKLERLSKGEKVLAKLGPRLSRVQAKKAVDEGLLPKDTNLNSGPRIAESLPTTLEQAKEFFTQKRKAGLVGVLVERLSADAAPEVTSELVKEGKMTKSKRAKVLSEIDKDPDIMFSKEVEELIDDNEFDTGQKNIDKLLEKYIKEKSFNLNSKTGIDDFFNAVETILVPMFPEGFISKTILRPSNRIFSKKNREENDKYYTERRDDLFLTNKQRQDKGLKPLKYGKQWSGEAVGFKQRVYEAVFGNTPEEINKANKQGKIKKFNDQNLSMHRQMWDRINKSIQKDPKNAKVIANFMKMVGNLKTHPHRLGAEMVAWDKNPVGDGKKLYEWEHAMPATSAYLYLMDAALSGANFNKAYDAITDNYKLIALDKNSDNKLKAAKLTTSMPKGWRVLSNFWWQRYFNPEVGAIDGGINPDLLEFIDGLTAATKFNIDTNGNLVNKELIKSKKQAARSNDAMLPPNERVGKDASNQEVLDKMAEIDDVNTENELVASKEAELSEEFNKIIEGKTGIGKDKRYSRVKAEVVGANKGRFNWFIPPSAEDFVGLLYKTLGKGKVGDTQMAWYKAHLLNPFAKAMDNISRDRVALMNDFKALKKELKVVPKTLKKKIPGENFTQEQAVRVYIWNKQGMSIPGMAQSDIKELTDFIEKNPDLVIFADQLIEMQKGDQYAQPTEGWLAGNITTDLIEGINTVKRSKYLEVWQQNVDEIFSEPNLNKLEAAYGKNYRVALENILRRMKTGKNRSFGGDTLTGRVTDWLTNSIGAIMFFNTRSAVLQTISAINFINFSDNNIFKAGKAFGNQKQFWSDFKTLFNSDFLVERRDGLRLNVNEADIADMAKKGGVRGVISELLRLGFLPTQIADSFAIASGGSTFYRNRIKALEKQGMSKKEAETQAFQDFRETAEESQQSSRPDRISQQQAGPLGRIILAFANTPAQYARLIKKAASDLRNGRGDAKSNISKIVYYGIAQNLIFNALQQALFALAFDDEEEKDEKKEKRYINVVNGMADSILRGAGISGAIFSVLKNVSLRLSQESEKKSPEYQDVLVKEIAQISPPISSKLGKLRQAGRSYSWNKKEMREKGWSIDNPAYLAAGQVIAATTNIPLDRAFKKIDNIRNASDSDLQAWQRIASLAGWSDWELGIKDEKPKSNKRVSKRKSRRVSKKNK